MRPLIIFQKNVPLESLCKLFLLLGDTRNKRVEYHFLNYVRLFALKKSPFLEQEALGSNKTAAPVMEWYRGSQFDAGFSEARKKPGVLSIIWFCGRRDDLFFPGGYFCKQQNKAKYWKHVFLKDFWHWYSGQYVQVFSVQFLHWIRPFKQSSGQAVHRVACPQATTWSL